MSFFKRKKVKEQQDSQSVVEISNQKSDEQLGEKISKEQWENFKYSHNRLYFDYVNELQKKINIFKGLAISGVTIAVIAVGWHLSNPIIETVPYVMKEDRTGAIDFMTVVSEKELTRQEATDQFWVAEFVRNYEKYNNYNIQDSYDRTMALSSDVVKQKYDRIYSGENARHIVFGTTSTREVKIKSINLDYTGAFPLARVRFETITNNGDGSHLENWSAVVSFEYLKKSMSLGERLLNPLGFTVRSYDVSNEISQ